jgi:hypothetical protein
MGKDNIDINKISEHIGLPGDAARDITKTDIIEGLTKSITHHCHKALPHAAKMIGLSKGELQKYFLGAEVKEEVKINAVRESNEDNRFSVIIYQPLMSFYWHMAKLWATRVGVMEIPGSPLESTEFSFNETTAFAKELMEAFWTGRIHTAKIVPLLNLSKNQTIFAGKLLHYGECFAVAHEFGHAIIEIADGLGIDQLSELSSWARSWARFYAHEFLESYPDYPKDPEVTSWGVEDFAQAWAKEFTADLLGANMIMTSADNDIEKISILWAAETTLVMLGMLESYYHYIFGQVFPLTSHPFSKLRLRMLRSIIQAPDNPEIADVGRAFEEFGEDIMEKIEIRNNTDET